MLILSYKNLARAKHIVCHILLVCHMLRNAALLQSCTCHTKSLFVTLEFPFVALTSLIYIFKDSYFVCLITADIEPVSNIKIELDFRHFIYILYTYDHVAAILLTSSKRPNLLPNHTIDKSHRL